MPRYLPREHGGWSMLAVSFLTGAANGSQWRWEVLCLGGLLFAGYSLRLPTLAWLQRRRRDALPWIAGYLGLSVLASVPLFFHPRRAILLLGLAFSLIPFGLTLFYARRRQQRSVLAEWIGVLGLTFVSVLAYYVTMGDALRIAWHLWTLNALYFGSSIFYVKMRLDQHLAARRGQPNPVSPYRRWSLIYHGAVILILLVLVLLGQLPPLIFLAFSPLLARVWIQTRRLPLSLRQLGFTELGMSLIYALGVIGLI